MHVQELVEVLRSGVVLAGVCRAVRLRSPSDYEALCTISGHNGASAIMPCSLRYSTQGPSEAQAEVDLKYGTLQVLGGTRTLRTAAYLHKMAAALFYEGDETVPTSLAIHPSIERYPLIAIDPRLVVPVSSHALLRIAIRLLRLAIEIVITSKSQAAGRI